MKEKQLSVLLVLLAVASLTKANQLTTNLLKVGQNAENNGATIPNFDTLKSADPKQVQETLNKVKADQDKNQLQID